MRSSQPSTLHPQPSTRSGFTLVEVLIVITILGMLMALTVVGIGKAMDAGRRTKMVVDISQLDQALTTYKTDRGDFPPSMFGVLPSPPPYALGALVTGASYDQVRFNRHVRQAFPRYRGGDPYTAFGDYVHTLNIPTPQS